MKKLIICLVLGVLLINFASADWIIDFANRNHIKMYGEIDPWGTGTRANRPVNAYNYGSLSSGQSVVYGDNVIVFNNAKTKKPIEPFNINQDFSRMVFIT